MPARQIDEDVGEVDPAEQQSNRRHDDVVDEGAKELTILPKGAPTIAPTARSITLPRIANSRNSSSWRHLCDFERHRGRARRREQGLAEGPCSRTLRSVAADGVDLSQWRRGAPERMATGGRFGLTDATTAGHGQVIVADQWNESVETGVVPWVSSWLQPMARKAAVPPCGRQHVSPPRITQS